MTDPDEGRVRVGVLVLPTDDWPSAVATAQRLESLGYDHLWTYDHFAWQRYHERPWHGTYTWLAGLAASTSAIGLGTMVANPNIRHPLALAKDVMTLDHISSGRFVLGVGAGGTGFDASVLGQEPLSPAERVDRLEEFAAVVDGLLRGELRDHDGRWYTIRDARLHPGCLQQPRVPIALAGGGRRALDLVASLGDAWITHGVLERGQTLAQTWDVIEGQVERIRARCASRGRSWDSLRRIVLTGNARESPLVDLDAFDRFVARAEELGFTDVVFHHPRPDDPVWDQDPAIVEEIGAAYGRPR